MKKLCLLCLLFALLLNGCGPKQPDPSESGDSILDHDHIDENSDELCELCGRSVIEYFDIYAINDLHGKFVDSDSQPGVDELSTFLKSASIINDNVIVLSSGDMWQGGPESNLTKGLIMTEWMNDIGFVSMTLGNHEFDWGEEYIVDNSEIADFPYLAINIYDRETDELVDYCQPSVIVERSGIQIGIIGAIGDCYSSISSQHVEDIYFITDDDLTQLVMDEAERLRSEGADFIIYSLHDGYGRSNYDGETSISSSKLSSYYDTALSNGYVDLVFEGHTHQQYVMFDEYGIYHLQNGGENNGISYVRLAINSVTGKTSVNTAEFISTDDYQHVSDDSIVNDLLLKYKDDIAPAYEELGINVVNRNKNWLRRLVADLYFKAGTERWGDEYDIVLGGGFISVRSPGHLAAGEVFYSDLQMLFPFDNELVLCSIQGRDLRNKFFETNNSNYFISYGNYGASVRNNIDESATYYVVTDTYSAYYAPNNLTIVEEYGDNIFARDLIAAYIKDGGLT